MLMTIEELRQFITTDKTDLVLDAQLQALELLIRKYTNNNFQDRNRRFRLSIRLMVKDHSTHCRKLSMTVNLLSLEEQNRYLKPRLVNEV